MDKPIKSGQFRGELITREGHDLMLDQFYKKNEWDKQTSWQLKETLEKLNLPEVVEIL